MKVVMYRTPGIQKGPVDSHTRGMGCCMGYVGSGDSLREGEAGGGHPASVTAQAVVLRKIITSSLY